MPRAFPVARDLRWLFVLPQLAALATMLLCASLVVGAPDGLVWGAGLYLAYSLGSRAILARHHRKGMRHVHRREWEPALSEFRRSQMFLESHPWIDRYRPLVLMSPSGVSYHEMALVNQAVCLIHLERGPEARRLYERMVEMYPDSPYAEAALKAMDSDPRPKGAAS